MSATVHKSRKGAVVAVLASLIASVGLATATPAMAAGNIDIDPAKTGSLTVHKYEAPAWDKTAKPNNGSELTAPADAKPLDGVKFKLRKVEGIDLTKSADWAKVKQLTYTAPSTIGGVPDATLAAAATEKTTENGGLAAFNGLKLGVYLVEETDAPTKVTKKVSPFFVTIPFPGEQGANGADLTGAEKGWLYNVHVYPKNDTSEVTKKVGDNTPTTSVGSDIEWVVGATIPQSADLKKMRIEDTIDPKVKYSANKAAVVKIGTKVLTENTHYTIDKGNFAQGAKISFTLTSAGITEANKAPGQKLEVTFYTTVAEALPDNKVPNKGLVVKFTNDPNANLDNEPGVTPPPGPDPDNPDPTAFFGDYNAKKVSAKDQEVLKGAKFGVYPVNAAGACGAAELTDANKIKEVTSDTTGLLAITDLYRGPSNADSKSYCLKELEAPAGFKLADEPKKITVTATTGAAGAFDGDAIPNTPYEPGDLPELPMTGANGQILLTLGGAAILAAATGTIMVTRRKKD